MNTKLRLQRLNYPYCGDGIGQKDFGTSANKFGVIAKFFRCAAMGHPSFGNGQIQRVLDGVHDSRRDVVGHVFDVSFHFADAAKPQEQDHITHVRPIYVLGPKNKLRNFESSLVGMAKSDENYGALTVSAIKEFMIADFIAHNPTADKQKLLGQLSEADAYTLHKETMGWLDLESGCFALRSMNALNRVRELFGMRPHLAMMKQRNYPSADLE